MKIGLTLSLCVADMIKGNVDIKDVAVIVSNTICVTDADWILLSEDYAKTYWRQNPKLGMELFQTLRARDLITQPRLRDKDAFHSTKNGIWIDLDTNVWAHQGASVDAQVS